MGRRNEGEATFEADGQTWHVRLDFNAMADFEAETGKNAIAVLETMEGGDASALDIRALFWAGLREHHPDVTLHQAGRLVIAGMEALQSVTSTALPSPEDGDKDPEKTTAATSPAA
jgi:hypothetical protein